MKRLIKMTSIHSFVNGLDNCQIGGTQLGRRNVPRYLYHLTTQNNYNKILKDGYIKSNHDLDLCSNLSGVFMFDLKNFTKRWVSMGVDCGDKLLTFAKALLMQVSKDDSNIVVLKIPTRFLSSKKLKCRSQVSKNDWHINNGDFATNQRHYTRKKEPLEYINETDIPIQNVIKIGEANSGFNMEKAFEEMNENYFDKINVAQVLQKLFQNTPEEKCINLILKQCNS